jgi:competence protein ComEA
MPYRVPIVNKPIYQPYQQTQPLSKINLNHAQKEDLIKIPGIGDITANNFLKARHARGKFDNWEQVKEISGIGDKRVAELKEKFYIP